MATISGRRGVTIPQMLFHEGEGLTVTVETRDGVVYRGTAELTEDNMNVSLSHVKIVEADGTTRQLHKVFIRGSQILLAVFPDILSKSPMFDRVRSGSKGAVVALGLGRGRQQAIMAKVTRKIVEGQIGGRGGPPIGRGQGPAPGPPPPFIPHGGQRPPPGGGGFPQGQGGPRPPMFAPPRPAGPPHGYVPMPQGSGFNQQRPYSAPAIQPPAGYSSGSGRGRDFSAGPGAGPSSGGRGRGVEMTRPAWMGQ